MLIPSFLFFRQPHRKLEYQKAKQDQPLECSIFTQKDKLFIPCLSKFLLIVYKNCCKNTVLFKLSRFSASAKE